MAQGLYKKVKPVTDPIVVPCTQIVVSEHMWVYFNFSYDIEFKDPTMAVVPDHGEYTLEVSQDGVNYEHWLSNLSINTAAYTRPYRTAGFITHVRATPSAENIPAMDTPPFPGELYCRVIVARA